MRILIDIAHPAHVHLFKNIVFELEKKGHEFFFTTRDNENEVLLLEQNGFNYKFIGKKHRSKIRKLTGLLEYSFKILRIALKFKPDLFLTHGSMYAGYAAFFLRKPHIALEDTGNMEQIAFSKPVSSVIISPKELQVELGKKHLKYDGYHELTYLHPKYFSPDRSVLLDLNVENNQPFVIVRFVSWGATHDIGSKGFSDEDKIKLIEFLSKKFKVFISTERELPDSIKRFQIDIPPHKMHDALSLASFYIGEGATMASEAGVLGTPSIYISPIKRCYTDDLEKYGLVFNIYSLEDVIKKVEEITSVKDYQEEFLKKREIMLGDKIDVTAFFVWFVENYPKSESTMRENPDIQLKFKAN